MSSIESQKNDYPYMYGYMEPVEVKELATCPLTHYEHGLYAAAHCLVSERVDKFDLVNMVYAILKREHSEMSKYTLPVLEWTDEPPKVPGWYWCRDAEGETRLRQLENFVGGPRLFVCGISKHIFPDELTGIQWAGPINEPCEPKE